MNPHELKQLTTRLAKAKAEWDELNHERTRLLQRINAAADMIRKLESQIEAESKEITVTEHALLRFCEHVLNVNLDSAKETILSGINRDLVGISGTSKHPIGFGCRAVMKGKSVVTVAKE